MQIIKYYLRKLAKLFQNLTTTNPVVTGSYGLKKIRFEEYRKEIERERILK